MDNNVLIEKIISKERLEPYLSRHKEDINKALMHYKGNIHISKSFYPLLAILEVGVRNLIDYHLTTFFNDRRWYENKEFLSLASRFQIDRISEAKAKRLCEKKEVTPSRIISEFSFGFWTSLFDTRFDMTLWKCLRLTFPNCPKKIRKRKTISCKLNTIRKLRNRIFHHEAISWNLDVLDKYRLELIEGIEWLDKGLLDWIVDLNHINVTIEKYRKTII